MNEKHEAALALLAETTVKVHNGSKNKIPHSYQVAAQSEYCAAYQKCVRLGLKPQVRGKYRGS